MAVDKNLFLHDLAIVATIKNEGHYLKEWLDYHLMAGVDHFYLYDHESEDNYNEIVKPYVDAGLVTSTSYPNNISMYYAYNDAVKRFKFQSRYMAFIDCDEFIYPKVDMGGACNVVEVVDEILSHNPNAAGLSINWQLFGSNGQETADYSRGVLERFTRRAPKDYSPPIPSGIIGGNVHIKTLANPRSINFSNHPHFPVYFESLYSVNENGGVVQGPFNNPVTAEKIVLNHYNTKSREEFFARKSQIRADDLNDHNKLDLWFDVYDCNDEFDDGILRYRAERAKTYRPPDNSHADERLLTALMKNLSPVLLPNTPPEFFAGKMETFLTCRAVSSYLKTRLTDDTQAKYFEEASLAAILKSFEGMTFADARIFIREFPDLLTLNYPAVNDIRNTALYIIPQMMEIFRTNHMWKDCIEFDYLQRLLKTQP